MCLGVWLLLTYLQSVFCYDVHLSPKEKPGTVVFSAYMNPLKSLQFESWAYRFDKKRSTYQAGHLLTLDKNTGVVTLREYPDCTRVLHNPFAIYIEASLANSVGYSNYTVLPLRIFIHGENCHIKYKQKHQRQTHLQTVSVQLESLRGTCVVKDCNVLELSGYVPQWVAQQCTVQYTNVDTDPSQLQVEQHSGYVKAKQTMCFTWPYKILQIRLSCGRMYSVPWRVIIYTADSLDYATQDSLSVHSQFSPFTPKSRSRRGASPSPPVFPQRMYVENVPEEQGAGYVIDTITATIPDADDSDRITYSLLATRDRRSQDMFTIDAASGQLTTTQVLDREGIAVHHFQVIAADSSTPALSGYATLTIYVDDLNDHAPQFESDLYTREISESISVSSTILTVRASDGDTGPNADIEYSILNPSGVNNAFRIDPRQGSIVTRQRLDRERQDSYRLEIQASDRAAVTNRKTGTSVVEITVLDENDNKPQFSQKSYTVDVLESIDYTTHPVIAEITAVDSDAGDNGVIRYSLTGSFYGDVFAIDPVTGELSVQQALDYDEVQVYFLNVRAQDSGSPYKSNSTSVTINVIDVNDNDPVFFTSRYHESVVEDQAIGYTIIRVQAYDADSGLNSALQYSIVDAPENFPIEVDRNTGEVMIKAHLDREQQSHYSFTLEARDQGSPPRSATTMVEISILDVNDNAPIFDPRVYNQVISEEAPRGTPVVAVTAVDADENARIVYTIQDGNIGGAFSIDSQRGQALIRVAKVLNYQEQSRYILTVKASDGKLEDTASVFINISDYNTFRPHFQGTPYVLRVSEDKAVGASVYKVLATDDDVGENARITYTLDDNPAFRIDGNTGELFVKQELDREDTPGYTISVMATDHGRPPKIDTTDIEISIADVNDNSPEFLQPEYHGRVFEDSLIGTSILTISAVDEDSSLNGMIRYTFVGGNSGGGDFQMDSTLGILRTAKELDRERTSHYELRAFAVDRGTPEKSTSVVINIDVEDINDNAPQFESPSIDLFIRENSPIGTKVDELVAVDPDEGPNADVVYSIAPSPDVDAFSLTVLPDQSVAIHTLTELDYEGRQKEYHIVVRARSAHLFSDVSITIHVQDVNDNTPQLDDFVIIFNNYKDHFPTGEIGRIPAHDPDEYDELQYRFISGNQANILHLNPFTGKLRLDSRLNSDVPTNGTLQVSVTGG